MREIGPTKVEAAETAPELDLDGATFDCWTPTMPTEIDPAKLRAAPDLVDLEAKPAAVEKPDTVNPPRW